MSKSGTVAVPDDPTVVGALLNVVGITDRPGGVSTYLAATPDEVPAGGSPTTSNVNLPPAHATPAPSDAKPITVTVNAQGQVFLNAGSGDTQVELPNLAATLQTASQTHQDQTIFVRGDKSVDYGTMMQVMATITQSGFTKVHLLTNPGGH